MTKLYFLLLKKGYSYSDLIWYSVVVSLIYANPYHPSLPLQPISLMESYNLPLIGALDHGSHTLSFLPESVSPLDNCNDFNEFPSSMNMK